jgi:hypothetical protein
MRGIVLMSFSRCFVAYYDELFFRFREVAIH